MHYNFNHLAISAMKANYCRLSTTSKLVSVGKRVHYYYFSTTKTCLIINNSEHNIMNIEGSISQGGHGISVGDYAQVGIQL